MLRLRLFLPLITFLLVVSQHSRGDIFETLLMPGKVIEGHAKYESECSSCHASFKKSAQRHLCLDCHEKVAADFAKHQGYHGRLANSDQVACKSCHTDHKGRDADIIQFNISSFNHQTDFTLDGKHRSLSCSSCHEQDKKYRDAPSQCISCHEDQDRHQGNLGETCNDCHNEKGWQKVTFDHNETDFPLEGKHNDTSCSSCHPGEQYAAISTQCINCHLVNDQHAGTHGNQCDNCHSTETWEESKFEHNRDTEFQLRHTHKKLSCTSCHQDSLYQKSPPTKCYGCHKQDDRHSQRNGEQCDSCHNEKKWDQSHFDHDKKTDFPLRGKHSEAQCDSCHKGDLKEPIETTCITCHQGEDVHAGQQGDQCEQCHNERSFTREVRFDHDISLFPLIGQHAVTSCDECHLNQTFKDTSLSCASCHENDDPHKSTLGSKCETCHTPNAWALWRFDHNKQSDFQLDGKHKGLACQACHNQPTNNKVTRQSSCNSCHSGDDKHFGEFGKNCDRCHTTDSFSEINKMMGGKRSSRNQSER